MLDIRGTTILMQPPAALAENTVRRRPAVNNDFHENLISKERVLRRLAYKNTPIKTDEAFFDDTDMQAEYYMIIVYSKKLNTALLTARYYFDKSLLSEYLKGDANTATTINKEGELFLIDRMSANITCSVYRRHRDYIHSLFYLQILKHKNNGKFIAMARKEPKEKLLTKYQKLGLDIVGSAKHQGKEHWILLGDLKKSYSQLKLTAKLNLFLISILLKFQSGK
jgi:hypothetical protein